ncbi:MAG: transcription antitermination factor NusB [Patescibacteria group bacterium]|nr:transcription antitermination factor NusB [Patescibacteria group bacterium]
MDKRHQKRIKIIQNLYALTFKNLKDNLPDKNLTIIKDICQYQNDIDQMIKKYAAKFSLDKIAKIDLAILRWGTYELKIRKKLPPKVIIDEAIELAKELANEKSYAFVNAVLGKIMNDKNE